jgi:hypothetical protein
VTPQNKKSKPFDSEFLTNWPTKLFIISINLRKEILRPGLNFMMLFIIIFRTRNTSTNCGRTPVWQRPVLTASKTCRLFTTRFLLTQITILCNLIQVTNATTRVFIILDLNPRPAYKSTKPRNLPLMPMLRKKKFELTNCQIVAAQICTIKRKVVTFGVLHPLGPMVHIV